MARPRTHTSSPPGEDAQKLREATHPEESCESEQVEVEDPDVILPPGLREFRLSQEDAQKMEHLLDDSGHPTHDQPAAIHPAPYSAGAQRAMRSTLAHLA